MKKKLSVMVIISVVLSGLGIGASITTASQHQTMNTQKTAESILFSSHPQISEKYETIEINLAGATTERIEPNKPVLPIYVKTYQLPFGSENIHVTCIPQNVQTMTLTKEIKHARIIPISKIHEMTTAVKDASVYGSTALYPATWYQVELSAGRTTNNEKTIFVKVICYPIRYSPAHNQMTYANSFSLFIQYEAPSTQPITEDTYDMVIIAPRAFESTLQPLIDHKNTHGINTTFKSVQDILDEYAGADPPEQIKYFIKYAYDTWGIDYVMLVGGLKSHLYAKDKDAPAYGSKAWWVPVRYVSIPQGDDEGCLSDLYYGCLYNGTGGFDSWDTNGDGVYAEWIESAPPKDRFDMNPEVYVSRLPVTTTKELGNIISKIITYESTGPSEKPWYKNFVGVGGKTFEYYAGKPDGEYLCDLAFNSTKNAIPDLIKVPVYSTNRDTSGLVPVAKDIAHAITQGAGFVDFEGHGSPMVWDTIWFDGTYPEDWCGGINLYDFLRIRNREKLPVVIVGGCHNGMYNVTLLGTLLDKTGAQYFSYGIPMPVCFSWGLVVKPHGGAIASTGCTGYGMGYEGNPVTLSGELESNFFFHIGNGSTHLAQTHSQAISKFLAEEEIGQVEAFCITNWALFGDPSLRFGGYSS